MEKIYKTQLQKITSSLEKILEGDFSEKTPLAFAEIEQVEDAYFSEFLHKVNEFITLFLEANTFIQELSKGHLTVDVPKNNNLISSYKQLHSNLQHLVWQISQISEGDYSQNIQFLGSISDHFNKMIESLREKKEIEEQLRYNAHFHKLLSDISTKFIDMSVDTFKERITEILHLLCQFFKTERVFLFELSPISDVPVNTYEWNEDSVESILERIQNSQISKYPWLKNEFIRNQPVLISGLSQLPEEAHNEFAEFSLRKIKSFCRIPVIHKNEFTGYLGFDTINFTKEWKEIDVSLMKIIASKIAEIFSKYRVYLELQNTKLKAENSAQAKADFFTNLSHEIRTPLNNIIGFSDLLNNTPLNPIQEQYLQNINISAQSLLDIINDTLDFSKIEAGKFELNETETDIFKIAELATENIKFQVSRKNLELIIDIPLNAPRFIIADSQRLKQILLNLLSNAVKYTDKGEIELSMKWEEIDDIENTGIFTFSVRDTGRGISLENQERIFHKFSQANDNTTESYGGTGLGLVISNTFANLMGSNIELESQPGKGSTFSFSLKRKFRKTDELLPAFPNLKKVLIVDDNPKIREFLAKIFNTLKISTVSAGSGLEVLEIIKLNRDFDIIFIDFKMPSLNGLDSIRLIRENIEEFNAEQPIVLLHNASENAALIESSNALKINYRLIKPVKVSELIDIMKNIDSKLTPENSGKTKTEDKAESQNLRKLAPHILIAEDVEINLLLIKTIIRQLLPSAKIAESKNGEDAVEKAKSAVYDIIFMDVQMPLKDGYQATAEIRKFEKQHHRYTPVIALTAHAFHHEKEKCIESGMDEYLVKPINIHLLEQILIRQLIQAKLPNEEKNKLRHFDRESLFEVTNFNKEAFKKLIDFCYAQIVMDSEELKTSILNNDSNSIKSNAHKIRGVALNMRCNILSELALQVEENTNLKPEILTDLHCKIIEEISYIKQIID